MFGEIAFWNFMGKCVRLLAGMSSQLLRSLFKGCEKVFNEMTTAGVTGFA